jgi:hypothetical protein
MWSLKVGGVLKYGLMDRITWNREICFQTAEFHRFVPVAATTLRLMDIAIPLALCLAIQMWHQVINAFYKVNRHLQVHLLLVDGLDIASGYLELLTDIFSAPQVHVAMHTLSYTMEHMFSAFLGQSSQMQLV